MSKLITDWERCKKAHEAFEQMDEAQGKWIPATVQPFFERLHELATAFKNVHDMDFDPERHPLSSLSSFTLEERNA